MTYGNDLCLLVQIITQTEINYLLMSVGTGKLFIITAVTY